MNPHRPLKWSPGTVLSPFLYPLSACPLVLPSIKSSFWLLSPAPFQCCSGLSGHRSWLGLCRDWSDFISDGRGTLSKSPVLAMSTRPSRCSGQTCSQGGSYPNCFLPLAPFPSFLLLNANMLSLITSLLQVTPSPCPPVSSTVRERGQSPFLRLPGWVVWFRWTSLGLPHASCQPHWPLTSFVPWASPSPL